MKFKAKLYEIWKNKEDKISSNANKIEPIEKNIYPLIGRIGDQEAHEEGLKMISSGKCTFTHVQPFLLLF